MPATTPRRRSSRLRGLTPKADAAIYASPSKLTVVAESDENADMTAQLGAATPSSTTRPSPQDIHPSRFQSALKRPATEQRFGKVSSSDFPSTPTTINHGAMLPPSSPVEKLTAKRQSFAAPDYQFEFRQSTDMSTEAQRLMDEVRAQAAKIKADLNTGREEQERKENEIEKHYGRKMATPKGQKGRYSDVHKEEFSGMSSIANHASKFRAGASQSAAAVTTSPAKVTITKVPLKPEAPSATLIATMPSVPSFGLKRTASNKSLRGEKDDNASSPAKRRRTNVAGMIARIEEPSVTASPRAQSRTGISGIATPGKTGVTRVDSVKSLVGTTMSSIPTFPKSPALKPLNTPTVARVEAPQSSTKRPRSSFVQRLTSMKSVKSILRRPQIHYSNDPLKLAAGTHVSTPTKIVTDKNIDTLLPDIAGGTPASIGHRKEKHVNFSPSKEERSCPPTPTSPSPTKTINTVVYPTLNLPSMANTPKPLASTTPTHIGLGSARSRASIANPGDFTFRSATTINFSPSRDAATNITRTSTPTIRKVRASDASYLLTATTSAAAKLDELPHVPHGLSNKKRKRNSADKDGREKDELVFGPAAGNGGSDKENAVGEREDRREESPSKRVKMSIPRPTGAGMPGIATGGAAARAAKAKEMEKKGGASKIPKRGGAGGGTGKSVLSMARLAALSKPKGRE